MTISDSEKPYEPHFVIDPTTDDDTRHQLVLMEMHISDQPETFKTVLARLGATAFSSEAQHTKILESQPITDHPIASMILDYFGKRLDREAEFDARSEEFIAGDTKYQQLLEEMTSKKNYIVKTGIQSSTMRANPDAEPARNAVRHRRIEAYAEHVIHVHSLSLIDTTKPEAAPAEDEDIVELIKKTELPEPRYSEENGALRAAG